MERPGQMNNDLCPRCGASLHFNDETGMFCPACVRGGAFNIANEQAKIRQAADRALAATQAERVARALRGEQMPPPFAVCEGHAARLEALEASVAALWQAMEVQEVKAAFEHVNKRDRDVLAALNDEPTPCPVVTRVEVRDHFGRCLFFAAPANDVDLRYSDDGKTLTVVLRR